MKSNKNSNRLLGLGAFLELNERIIIRGHVWKTVELNLWFFFSTFLKTRHEILQSTKYPSIVRAWIRLFQLMQKLCIVLCLLSEREQRENTLSVWVLFQVQVSSDNISLRLRLEDFFLHSRASYQIIFITFWLLPKFNIKIQSVLFPQSFICVW